jgi:SAM-dependent methyltransferase
LDPELEQHYWDEIAEGFENSADQALWRRHSDRINRRLLEAWLPSTTGGRVLKTDVFDEAVGEGLFPFLSERFSQVDGIDVSARAIRAATNKYPDLVAHCNDLRELPFSKPVFDCVVSNSSLDHFRSAADLQQSLGELHRVIRPGGQLIITMDNLQNPMVWLRNHLPQGLLKKIGLVPYFVGVTVTRRGLVRMLEGAGFEILDTTAILHCPRALAVARSRQLQDEGDRGRRERFLRRLDRWEALQRWPSRYFSGYFAAARARRSDQAGNGISPD